MILFSPYSVQTLKKNTSVHVLKGQKHRRAEYPVNVYDLNLEELSLNFFIMWWVMFNDLGAIL